MRGTRWPGAAATRKTRGVGLTLWQLLGELQVPVCLLGRRLSGVQASRTTVAAPNGTSTRPGLTEHY